MPRALTSLALLAATGLAIAWLLGSLDQIGAAAQAAQRTFQTHLAAGLRALRAGEPGALAALWGMCFAYGFLHALGPGHGKFLLGAYAAGAQAPLGPMVGVGLAASLGQGVVAIALVYGGVLIFDASREALQITADIWLERASLIAIALIGLWLMSRAARKLYAQLFAAPVAVAASGHGGHCSDCGHRHGPELHEVAALHTARDTAALIGAIAIRPCTGALFVLILTWRMGLVWQGMVAVLIMALGTAAVTMVVAALAVLAREGAMGWAGRMERARLITPWLEGVAGLAVVLVALNMLKML